MLISYRYLATPLFPNLRELAIPDSRRPLKTHPNPPSPIKLASLKFWVAVASSLNAKLRAALPFGERFALPLCPKEPSCILFSTYQKQKEILKSKIFAGFLIYSCISRYKYCTIQITYLGHQDMPSPLESLQERKNKELVKLKKTQKNKLALDWIIVIDFIKTEWM